MPKGISNKRYTPEFKKLVIKTIQWENLNYRETVRKFEVTSHRRIQEWKRIYLSEARKALN